MCHVADLLETEVCFAQAGRPELWDRVERTVRNQLVPAQFDVTPDMERLWREINSDRSGEDLEAGLAGLRELEGGFLASFSPNDRLLASIPGATHHGAREFQGRMVWMDMAGCCAPSGMRALHAAWSNTVRRTPLGVTVNLALDHDGPVALVRSEVPRRGRLEVEPRVASDFLLRPPSWAPRSEVKAQRNGRPAETRWGGPAYAFVIFPAARPGEILALEWPLLRFKQRITQRYMENSEDEIGIFREGNTYTYHWTGNFAAAVEPRGGWLPLYG
jgi:hypothetical protein